MGSTMETKTPDSLTGFNRYCLMWHSVEYFLFNLSNILLIVHWSLGLGMLHPFELQYHVTSLQESVRMNFYVNGVVTVNTLLYNIRNIMNRMNE